MALEILTARELCRRGEIDEFEASDPNLFGRQRVMVFSSETERFLFAYDFVHNYLVPTYGKDAVDFPMYKTGPDRYHKRPEWRKDTSDPNSIPGWIAIPEERFSEVEEFLKKKYSNIAPEPKY